jgi:hypothetical protein
MPGAVLLDADVFAEDLISVVSPNPDYAAFRRSMMRLAHELAQNDVVVVYFSVMLPEQVLANSDVLSYFDSVHFLCLICPPDVLRARLAGRVGSGAAPAQELTARIEVWLDFNDALETAASVDLVGVVGAGVVDLVAAHDTELGSRIGISEALIENRWSADRYMPVQDWEVVGRWVEPMWWRDHPKQDGSSRRSWSAVDGDVSGRT